VCAEWVANNPSPLDRLQLTTQLNSRSDGGSRRRRREWEGARNGVIMGIPTNQPTTSYLPIQPLHSITSD